MRSAIICSLTLAGIATGGALAQTTQTTGEGSAVTYVDRAADFGPINVNGVPLSDYTENGLFIGTDADSIVSSPVFLFDPFHGADGSDRAFYCPSGGSQGWTEIRTTTGERIYALEFMYGNGWTTGQIYGPYPWGNNLAVVEWQTLIGSSIVSSGVAGGSPLLEMGTILGFYDPAGFDKIRLKCTIANSADPTLQALALDRLRVELFHPCSAPSIASQPVEMATCPDGGGYFDVGASGSRPYTYRWQRETTPDLFVDLSDGPTSTWDGNLPGLGAYVWGSDTEYLDILPDPANGLLLGPAHAVRYRCVVTNPCGSVASTPAQLTVDSGPTIISQPASTGVCPGATATFSVIADATYYQWNARGGPLADEPGHISGSNSPTLVITNASSADATDYNCLVSTACNAIATDTARLTVGPTCDFNQDGSADLSDVFDLADAIASGTDPNPGCKDFNQDGSEDTGDVLDLADAVASGTCP